MQLILCAFILALATAGSSSAGNINSTIADKTVPAIARPDPRSRPWLLLIVTIAIIPNTNPTREVMPMQKMPNGPIISEAIARPLVFDGTPLDADGIGIGGGGASGLIEPAN